MKNGWLPGNWEMLQFFTEPVRQKRDKARDAHRESGDSGTLCIVSLARMALYLNLTVSVHHIPTKMQQIPVKLREVYAAGRQVCPQ